MGSWGGGRVKGVWDLSIPMSPSFLLFFTNRGVVREFVLVRTFRPQRS